MKSLLRRFLVPVFALVLVPLAQAHPGHEGDHGDFTWDFSGGVLHPLTGFDHLIAMLAVGLWAAQLGSRARWLVPAAFVALMTAGAALGRSGFMLPGAEQMIAASVLVLGLLLATAARLPMAAGMTLVGLFAAFHGFAHGAEMPAGSQALSYGAGFVLATALIHAAGVGLGTLAAARSEKLTRYAGWAIAASGVVLLAV
ncbi:MAG: HupE/UreJ family protein [Verrucomicrobia bacterium]|nr:HupE/UreJ family protein [Verrucomicrobiota bacterium]